jgi:hypothetical protein
VHVDVGRGRLAADVTGPHEAPEAIATAIRRDTGD